MKNPVIKLLIIVVLFSQCCFFESLAPLRPTRVRCHLNANEWVSLNPEKKEYKVGDTLSITYKVPAKIDKYLDKTYESLIKDFNLRKHITPTVDALGSMIDDEMIKHIMEGNLTYIADGKKLKVKENLLYSHTYKYDEASDEYICNYQIVFLKPNISFFWDRSKSYDKKIQILPYRIGLKESHYKMLGEENELSFSVFLDNNEVKEFKVIE